MFKAPQTSRLVLRLPIKYTNEAGIMRNLNLPGGKDAKVLAGLGYGWFTGIAMIPMWQDAKQTVEVR